MSTLEFYYIDLSSPSRAAWAVLELLGIEYKEHIINLMKGEQKSDSFAKINPRQKVPALTDGDLRLYESRAIATYLVNAYGEKYGQQQLYPVGPRQRAEVDKQLYTSVDVSEIMSNYANIGGVLLHGGLPKTEDFPKVVGALTLIELFLNTKNYVAADHLTLADIFYYSAIQLLKLTDFDEWDKYPNVSGWLKRVEKMPCYQKTFGDPIAKLGPMYQNALKENAKS